jgi:hypothetical protein
MPSSSCSINAKEYYDHRCAKCSGPSEASKSFSRPSTKSKVPTTPTLDFTEINSRAMRALVTTTVRREATY